MAQRTAGRSHRQPPLCQTSCLLKFSDSNHALLLFLLEVSPLRLLGPLLRCFCFPSFLAKSSGRFFQDVVEVSWRICCLFWCALNFLGTTLVNPKETHTQFLKTGAPVPVCNGYITTWTTYRYVIGVISQRTGVITLVIPMLFIYNHSCTPKWLAGISARIISKKKVRSKTASRDGSLEDLQLQEENAISSTPFEGPPVRLFCDPPQSYIPWTAWICFRKPKKESFWSGQ